MPRPRRPELALAIGNLGAPGGLTRSVVLSLGAGLSLLVTVALVDRSIIDELTSRLPEESPNYFVLDIKRAESEAFHALVDARGAGGQDQRGADAARPPGQARRPPGGAGQGAAGGAMGAQRRPRPHLFARRCPKARPWWPGKWWPADYAGEPLVSFEAEIAKGLRPQDRRHASPSTCSAATSPPRIANLREVKWESLALNFVMVFSPNTLVGAPHNLLATVTLPKDAPLAAEAKLAQQIGRAFPASTAIRVKDAIDAFNVIFSRVMVAVRAAGSVTLLAGALVLAGALATAQRRRIQQAVILKTLGATSRRILLSHLAEYLVLAVLTAFISLLIGSLAAWITVSRVMDVDFAFSVRAAAEATLLATVLVALFGGFGTWRVLRAPPVPYLRSE